MQTDSVGIIEIPKETRKYWSKKLGKYANSILGKTADFTSVDSFIEHLYDVTLNLSWFSKKWLGEFKRDGFPLQRVRVDSMIIYGPTLHLETDIEDNSLGIKPKWIRSYVQKFGSANLESILWLLNDSIQDTESEQYLRELGYIDDDQAFDWDSYSRAHFKVANYESAHKALIDVVNTYYNAYCLVGNKTVFTDDCAPIISKFPFLVRNFRFTEYREVNLEIINHFLDERRAVWKAEKGICPKSVAMLLVEPKQFDVKHLDLVKECFQTKQISKLSVWEQYRVASLIDAFGVGLLEISTDSIGVSKLLGYAINAREGYKQIVGSVVKAVGNTHFLIDILTTAKTVCSKGVNLDRISRMIEKIQDCPDYYKEIIGHIILNPSGFINDDMLDEFLDFVHEFTPAHIKAISRYYGGSDSESESGRGKLGEVLPALFEIWKNRSQEQAIRPFGDELVAKNGIYKYRVVNKEDVEGLVLGYATDCCQVHNGVGRECLRCGFYDHDSTFFLVEKDGKIIAQSWIWLSHTQKTLCFDSIEVMGGSKRTDLRNIVKCYKHAAVTLLKRGWILERITVGSGGGTSEVDGLLGKIKIINVNNLSSRAEREEYLPTVLIEGNFYSDAKDTQFLLTNKEGV